MKPGIHWVEAQTGKWLGILPCALPVAVITIERTGMGRFFVSFGTGRLRTGFPTLGEAKHAGTQLAKRILSECVRSLED